MEDGKWQMKNLQRKILGYLVLSLVFAGVYLIRYFMVRHSYLEGSLIRVTGQISSDPVLYDSQQRIEVGAFRFYVERYPEFQYGEWVEVIGEIGKQERGYQEIRGVGEVRKVGDKKNLLYALRERVLEVYRSTLPERHAALLSGIVLGTKSSLDSQFFEALRKTSTLHVVVASGTNVSLLAGGIMAIFASIIGRRKAIFLTLSLVWLYVLLVGLQPPIIRAAIMGTIGFVALGLGRESSAIKALVMSAALMLLVWPQWLFDLGFQLSFLATLGVILLSPRILRLVIPISADGCQGRPISNGIREVVAISLGAQIAVAPLLYFNFGEVSLVGPVTNTLVLWTIPMIMLGGFFLGGFGLFGTFVAQPISWIVWLPLEYFVRVVDLFG